MGLFRRFSKVFWIVQSFEMMERGAYYLMMPILVYHAIDNVGLDPALGLVLTMFMYPFQYGIPILSGALAEKIGYRRQMIFAFTVLTFAYIFLSFANTPVMMVLGVMFIGFGIGSYKPLVSATVAKATSGKDRNTAYSIYYWIVNLAAFLFPTIWWLLEITGVVYPGMYAWVFRVGAAFMAVNIFTGIVIFKEIPRSGKVRSVMDAVNNVRTAFKDTKFVVMALLIAGFWALYSSMLNVLPIALLKFDFPTPMWVSAMFIGIFNPLTIIMVGVPLSKFVEKLESLKAIMGGVFLYLAGLVIIAVSLHNFYLVILGIILASVGEFMVAPGYLSFVSKLAPKEKVSAYIGSNFLASFLGLAGGTLINGMVFNWLGVNMGMPRLFYGILVAAGLILLVGFITYYKSWGQNIIERARKIKEMEEGLDESDLIKEHPTGLRRLFDIVDIRAIRIVPLLLIPLVIIATMSFGSNYYIEDEEDTADLQDMDWVSNTQIFAFSGYTNENGESSEDLPMPGMPVWINATLTWEEDPAPRLQTNLPDTFDLQLIPPEVTGNAARDSGDSGQIGFNFHTQNYQGEINGTWSFIVECTGAGDVVGPFGFTRNPDDGNDWSMTVTVVYLEKASPEE